MSQTRPFLLNGPTNCRPPCVTSSPRRNANRCGPVRHSYRTSSHEMSRKAKPSRKAGHGKDWTWLSGDCDLAHSAHVLDAELAWGCPQYPDDVDPDLVEDQAVGSHPRHRELAQAVRLLPGDRLERRAESHSRPGLDLADDQRPAIEGHDVDLAQGAAPVPPDHGKAGLDEELCRQLLALLSEQILRVHGHHLHRHPAWPGTQAERKPARPWTSSGGRAVRRSASG